MWSNWLKFTNPRSFLYYVLYASSFPIVISLYLFQSDNIKQLPFHLYIIRYFWVIQIFHRHIDTFILSSTLTRVFFQFFFLPESDYQLCKGVFLHTHFNRNGPIHHKSNHKSLLFSRFVKSKSQKIKVQKDKIQFMLLGWDGQKVIQTYNGIF